MALGNEERFNVENFILDPDKGFIGANIKSLKSEATNVYAVEAQYEYRLDLISNLLYNTVHMKWLLIYVNEIHSLEDIVAGKVLRYPDYDVYQNLLLDTIRLLPDEG